MFADDLVVHFKDKIINNIQIHLQNTINDIQYWLNKTGIQFTTAKTRAFSYLSPCNDNIQFTIQINFLCVILPKMI